MKLRQSMGLVLALLLLLTACQREPTAVTEPAPVAAEDELPASETAARPTPTRDAAVETAPEPTIEPTHPPVTEPTLIPEEAVSQPTTENVTIEAADGLRLHATYAAPGGVAPFPGVILLHMLGSDRQVWQEVGLTEALVADGYAVLALDMRGHGESGSDREWEKFDDDLLRVWTYFAGLDDVDENRTAVIGASIGSNMALRTGANVPDIKTVALLSPGLDYRRITTGDAIELYGDRPILIVASEEDSYAADSSRTLAEMAQGEASLQMYDGAGHGTHMFAAEPGLTQVLLDWLNQYLADL